MSTTPVRYDAELRVDASGGGHRGTFETRIHLEAPSTRIVMRVPRGTVGRAEAKFDRKSWAAAHYWTEETGDGPVVVFEFSEPLPAGDVALLVPYSTE